MLGSYDDLSVRVRADLTDEELERFKTYELMSAGVVREPRPVILDDEPKAVDLERTTWWEIGPCVFATAEAAEAFLELEPHTAETEWQAGYENKYVKAVDATAGGVAQVRLIGRTDFESHLGALKDFESAKGARDKARHKHEGNEAKVEKITRDIDDDYWNCKRQVAEAGRIVTVFCQYVETADGDQITAGKFLVKAYDRDRCAEAFELTRNEELVEFLPAPEPDDEPEPDELEAAEALAVEGEEILEAELDAEIAEAEALADEGVAGV